MVDVCVWRGVSFDIMTVSLLNVLCEPCLIFDGELTLQLARVLILYDGVIYLHSDFFKV